MKRFKDYIKEMRYGPGDRESTNVIRAAPYEKQDPIGAKIHDIETTSEHPKTTRPTTTGWDAKVKPAQPKPAGNWQTTVKPAKK